MNHRRIMLHVINENYSRINPHLPSEIIRYRLEFPREILPPYRFYISDVNPHVTSTALSIPLTSRIKYTEILLYTKYIGEYTEVEENEATRQKITYFREPDGGLDAGCPTKVEQWLPLA